MSDEKTEEPTEQRLRKAREEGEVSKSTDLVDSAVLAAGVLLLIATGGSIVGAMRACVTAALDFVAGPHDMMAIVRTLSVIGIHLRDALVPFVVAAVIAPLCALMPQVNIQISMKPVSFNFEAVDPVAGTKKIFSLKSLIDLLKMIIKGVLLVIVMWVTIVHLLPLIAGSMYEGVPGLSTTASQLIIRLLAIAAALYAVFGAIDVKVQQFLFIRDKKMGKDEIKREQKEDEGDPTIKGERRRLAREFATTERPSLIGAKMLVVNPTHYAVAVRYAPDEFPLPTVIAKGTNENALRLRQEAEQAGIPIIGHPPVARALYHVEVDQPIPEELFEAVAAILRWVNSLGLPSQMLHDSSAVQVARDAPDALQGTPHHLPPAGPPPLSDSLMCVRTV